MLQTRSVHLRDRTLHMVCLKSSISFRRKIIWDLLQFKISVKLVLSFFVRWKTIGKCIDISILNWRCCPSIHLVWLSESKEQIAVFGFGIRCLVFLLNIRALFGWIRSRQVVPHYMTRDMPGISHRRFIPN